MQHVLIMNGELDPQTPAPYGHTQYEGLEVLGGTKWMADFPGSTHGTSLNVSVSEPGRNRAGHFSSDARPLLQSAVNKKASWQTSKNLLGAGGLPWST